MKIIIFTLWAFFSLCSHANIVPSISITPEQFGAIGNGIVDDTEAVKKAAEHSVKLNMPFEGNKDYKVTTHKIPELAIVRRIGVGKFIVVIRDLHGHLQRDIFFVNPKLNIVSQSIPLIQDKTLISVTNKYAAFPKGIINKRGEILFTYYYSTMHIGNTKSEARALITRDKGRTWKDYFIVGNLTDILHGYTYTYAYDTALGLDANGLYIALISIANETGDMERYKTISYDGVFWSLPTKIHFTKVEGKLYKNIKRDPMTGDPATGKSEIVFFGTIKTLNNNKLAVMAYIANTNWIAISHNGLGDIWELNMIREKNDGLRISEMALGVTSENNMICIARVDGSVSSMFQYSSIDEGNTWLPLGYTNLDRNGGNLPQSIETVLIDGKEYFFLDKGQRMSRSGEPKYPNSYIRDRILSEDALKSALKWQGGVYIKHFSQTNDLDEQRNAVRDYYCSGITDKVSFNTLVVIHEETKVGKKEESKLKMFIYPLKEKNK